MSNPIQHDYDEAEATAFNARSASRLGFVGNMPREVLLGWPGLVLDPRGGPHPDEEEPRRTFALTVLDLQRHLGYAPEDRDGKLGHGTWRDLLQRFDRVTNDQKFLVIGGRRRIVDVPTHVRTTSFDQPGGLDMHPFGDFTKQDFGKPERMVVLHWGGHNAKSCFNALTSRGLSSHGGFDPDGLHQFVDLKHATWHAGKVRTATGKKKSMNLPSVGFDICQQPTVNHKARYEKRGYDVRSIPNPTDRGDREVLTLDSRTAEHVRKLLPEICRLLGIPFAFPIDAYNMLDASLIIDPSEVYHGVMNPDFLASDDCQGVVGHHSISPSKWDIACWFTQIFFPGLSA